MLQNSFSPVSSQDNKNPNELSVANHLDIHKENKFPEINNMNIALLSDDPEAMAAIRLQYYEMFHHSNNIKVVDLGNLHEQSNDVYENVFVELIKEKIIPVVLCKSEQIIQAFLSALDTFKSKHSIIHCSKKYSDFSQYNSKNLDLVKNIGIQGHLCKSDILECVENIRLSKIKNNMEEAEPHTRNMNTVVVDMDLVRFADNPGCSFAGPSGLNADEYTSLFRFFGFNDQLSAIFICGYEHSNDVLNRTAALIAQGIWYFVDAKNLCITEDLNNAEDVLTFSVEISGLDHSLVFKQMKQSGRWWMIYDEQIYPCSYNDYILASRNEIPDRLVRL